MEQSNATPSPPDAPQVVCLAVVGANNAPLFMRTYPCGDTLELSELKLQEVIYNALDVIEERTHSGQNSRRDKELGGFVGCLAVVAGLSVYGSVTSTHRKLLVAISGGGDTRDMRVRDLFKSINRAIAQQALNPFRSLDAPLGKDFERESKAAIERFSGRT